MNTLITMAVVMNLSVCAGVNSGRLLGLASDINDALVEVDIDTGEVTFLHYYDVKVTEGGLAVGPDGTLYAAFSGSVDQLVILDPDTTLPIEFNDLGPRMLDYSREEFAKLPVSAYEARENPDEIRAHAEKVLRNGCDEFETTMRTKRGKLLDLLVNVRVVEIGGRRVFHSIFRDITERKQAEQERARLAAALESAGEAILITDVNGSIEYVNAAIRRHRQDEDRVGVIVFGRDAMIEIPPFDEDVQVPQLLESQFDPNFTDLAGAMRLAQASFPEDAARRIVLVSDGAENLGDALKEARALAAAGVGIDVVPIRYQRRGEVILERLADLEEEIAKGREELEGMLG